MKELDEIFSVVAETIENSIGTPKEEIGLKQTIFDELAIDSIDMVDILFELESHYGIELKVSDIESRVREELGDTPYEVEGIITTEGLVMLRKHMRGNYRCLLGIYTGAYSIDLSFKTEETLFVKN